MIDIRFWRLRLIPALIYVKLLCCIKVNWFLLYNVPPWTVQYIYALFKLVAPFLARILINKKNVRRRRWHFLWAR